MLRQQTHDLRELDLVHLEDILHGLVRAHNAAVGRVLQLVLLHVGPTAKSCQSLVRPTKHQNTQRTYNSLTAAGRESCVLPRSPCSGVDRR